MELWHVWAIVALLFFIAEVFFPIFIMISFGIGCVFASIAAGLGGGLAFQMAMFVVGTLMGFVAIKPLIKSFLYAEKQVNTNYLGLVGKVGKVVIPIDPSKSYGEVAIDGDRWRAESATNEFIEADTRVEIVNVDTTLLTVKPVFTEASSSKMVKEKEPDAVQTELLLSVGSKKMLVQLNQLLYAYSSEKTTFLVTNEGKQFVCDESLDKLEFRLPKSVFFRANRQFIITKNCIKEIQSEQNGKVKVVFVADMNLPACIMVSRLKKAAFRKWFLPYY